MTPEHVRPLEWLYNWFTYTPALPGPEKYFVFKSEDKCERIEFDNTSDYKWL